MNSIRIALVTVFACLPLLIVSCDKIGGALKQVEGKVAGQVLNNAGRGRGYVSVVLVPEAGGEELPTTTEEAGNFLIESVPPGTYILHVKLASGIELASDTPKVKVGPGRTIQQNIILSE